MGKGAVALAYLAPQSFELTQARPEQGRGDRFIAGFTAATVRERIDIRLSGYQGTRLSGRRVCTARLSSPKSAHQNHVVAESKRDSTYDIRNTQCERRTTHYAIRDASDEN